MTCGPPILPSASAARLLTHQSASRIAFSRYLTELSSPTTFSTSTAARRAPSDSSFSTSTRWRTVSGCLLRHRSSIAGFCTSSSGSRSSGATRAGSTWPLPFVMARSAAARTSLFGSLSVRCSAARTFGVSKRASSEMMCVRAIVSLPSTRETSSSTESRVHQLACDPEQGRLLVRVLLVGGIQQVAQVEAVLLRRDHVEDRGLGDRRVLQQIEQQVRRVVARGGERPGDACDRARVLLRQRLGDQREGLVVDQRRQRLDERDRLALVGGRKRVHDRL